MVKRINSSTYKPAVRLRGWVVLVFALMTVPALVAQSTWHGLKFGMSETEIRQAYQGTLQAQVGPSGGRMLVDTNQKLSVWKATAYLHLDDDGKLASVEVIMKDPFALQSTTSALGLSFAVIPVLNDELVQKYGRPVTATGDCNATIDDVLRDQPDAVFNCEKLWRANAQTINMSWSISSQRLSFWSIEYKPLPTDI